MPRISKTFISERLLPAVDIAKLIGSMINLKKKGPNYVCCCPFHNEKTPSFTITPSKQMYYCFGCHEHGDAIQFLRKFKNLGFVEAVEELAAFAGLQVEYENGGHPEPAVNYQPYYELMQRCEAAFSRALFDQHYQQALDYFMKKRELTRETILSAGLGFAPEHVDFLKQEVCRTPEDERMLVELGMLVKHDERPSFPMFRGRVMIPIRDRKGRVISFGGRTLGSEQPKYMNTKETLIYRKRNELFGLYEVLKATNNRPECLVIMEGYMDVIAVRQAGFNCAVASLGTSTTPEHFRLMMRYTNKIVCCYDGDAAGRKAAWHALETAAPELTPEVEMRFAFLPPEDDPDSLVRSQGLQAFLNYLDNSISYPEFLISHIQEGYDLQDPGQLSHFISAALGKIATLPMKLKPLQVVALTLLSKASHIEERQLYDMLSDSGAAAAANSPSPEWSSPEEPETAADGRHILSTPMRRLMAFILQHPALVAKVYDDFELDTFITLYLQLGSPGAHELQELLYTIHASSVVSPAAASGEQAVLGQTPPSKTPLTRLPAAQTPAAYTPSELTPAILLARSRGTPLEHIYTTLISVPISAAGCGRADASERDNMDFFVDLITEVLVEPLRKRADYLTLHATQGGAAAQQEVMAIRSELARRGVLKPRG